ncbi:MAG TPA: class II aldolase/adducin family protein [Candidatus Binatia bacterium]|nr:class II aldolase/adducin family protein [Candidatus Binatia bacterium]
MAKKLEKELKEKVATACRILAAAGICSGIRAAVGHASARIPGTNLVVIKGRGYRNDALESMRPEDQLIVDLDCNMVSGPKGIAPAAEIKLYTHVYKTRPEVGGIVHAHPRFTTVMSVINIPMSVVCHEGAHITLQGVPVFDEMNLISTDETGAQMAAALGQQSALLLKAHGAVTVGKTVEQATVNMIDLEEQARMNYYCLSAGGPDFPRVPPKEVETFVKFRREELHELPWLKRYGFTQLSEESAWTWNHFSRRVARANKR